jgi:hypothetical protein
MYYFCVLAADADTVSAADAPFDDYFRLPLNDADSFGRAFPDAGVALAASFFNGFYKNNTFPFMHICNRRS